MLKIYIAGKITGEPLAKAREKFAETACLLSLKGFDPVNPMEVSPYVAYKPWNDYMSEGIAALLQCEAIYLLNDWGQSRGARVEYAIAKELGLQVFFEGAFNISSF